MNRANTLQSISAALLLICILLFNTAAAQSIDDPDQVGWSSIRGYTSEKFGEYFKKKSNQGYRVVDIEVDKVNGKRLYSAIWQHNTDNRKWRSLRDQTHEQFSDTWNSLKDNYRLIDQEAYKVGNSMRYAGVWVENKENIKWLSYRNLNEAQFKENFNKNKANGYRMVDIEAYKNGGKTAYSAIWVKNSGNTAWAEFRNMSASEYAAKFKSFRDQGYRVLDLESYRLDGKHQYAAIWVKNTNKRGWKALRDMSAQGYANAWKTARDQGYRLEDFEAYDTNKGTRYAGVWRQNGERLSWGPRKSIDKLVEKYRIDNNIPGVSVAIGKKGKIVYERGFGLANVKENSAAHAGTIYRLASVSKPVTALLAMRLIDENKLSVDKPTLDYVSDLPAAHTHTVRQLLEHRSGIRHYKGSRRPKDCKNTDPKCCWVPNNLAGKDKSSSQFSTQNQAMSLFIDDALRFSPGSKQCYSTHAYTVAGAALEGAAKSSFPKLIEQHFGQALGLPTLRAENMKKSVKERAMIYKSTTSEAKRDNISWKYAGGGLESSATDMARLGLKLFAGQVTKDSTRKSFWKNNVFGHSGAQNGAKTYWRLDFGNELVVIVLANRNAGDPTELAKQIANLAK
ncbi:serine hydrolase [Pseudoalteromonas sp. T1lg22]|uniref:serine hydrolase n=1 Tax=Pseudoalteromonas sp. T1lg22 TaxID=2077096 RepID=UPI000CF69ABD|nr:serine hydrolase [Pseudoalteromonas sp. T1lg22]